jgi:adenylate cyclase, class 2
MTTNDQELEVKYYIADLPALEKRLQSLGAQLVQPRIHELNLRFDVASGEMLRTNQVLRLRQDTEARLTYKGPSQDEEGVRVRQEIEFIVSDHRAARAFLEALGYHVSMGYEKYRTTYDLDGAHVVLDEMPYGNFTEIEGPDPATIQAINRRLGLDWEKRVPLSYTFLFDLLREKLSLPFTDLSFENFQQLSISPADLDVQPADK